jgi:hypothetical protein
MYQQLTDPEGPALTPPMGAKSDFSGHSEGEMYYYILLPLFTILSGILLILRIYTKLTVVRKFNVADCEFGRTQIYGMISYF